MTVIVFDNDECTGQYGFTSLIYFKLKELGFLSEKEIIKLSQICFEKGAARPGLKYLFQKLKKLKKDGKIKAIVMYTNAMDGRENYVRDFLKNSLEKYTKVGKGFFDLVLTYEDSQKDPEIRLSSYNNNDIRKKLELVKDKLLKKKKIKATVDEMIMIDDKVKTILDFHKCKLKENEIKFDIKVMYNGEDCKPILINVPPYKRTYTFDSVIPKIKGEIKEKLKKKFGGRIPKNYEEKLKKMEINLKNSYNYHNEERYNNLNENEKSGKVKGKVVKGKVMKEIFKIIDKFVNDHAHRYNFKDCPENYIRNPNTNRCIKIGGCNL